MKEFQKDYEGYVKGIVDTFSDMCSVKRDYDDYTSYIQENDSGAYYNFRQADTMTLMNMLNSGEFNKTGVQELILERQEKAKRWLSENLMTYDEWVSKYKQN